MKSAIFSIGITLAVLASLTLSLPVKDDKACDPDKCKLPDCRCWNDKHRPGNDSTPVPQLILLTFDYAFNEDTVKLYKDIFEGLRNPNGCKSKGTFFVQALNSDLPALKDLRESHHELAINSANGIIPTNKAEWEASIREVVNMIEKSGAKASDVKGVRAPQLFSGGNNEFETMKDLNLEYDASCVSVDYSAPTKLLWPYTLDNIHGLPSCSIGHNVNETFPGIWNFPVPVLDYSDLQCPTPSGCIPKVNTTDGVFQLFYESFDAHYSNGHVPFTIDIDTLWVTENFRVTGTKEFLQLISAYPDTWIVTMSDALSWVQDADNTDMSRFGCSDDE